MLSNRVGHYANAGPEAEEILAWALISIGAVVSLVKWQVLRWPSDPVQSPLARFSRKGATEKAGSAKRIAGPSLELPRQAACCRSLAVADEAPGGRGQLT